MNRRRQPSSVHCLLTLLLGIGGAACGGEIVIAREVTDAGTELPRASAPTDGVDAGASPSRSDDADSDDDDDDDGHDDDDDGHGDDDGHDDDDDGHDDDDDGHD